MLLGINIFLSHKQEAQGMAQEQLRSDTEETVFQQHNGLIELSNRFRTSKHPDAK